ncbi:hypothetical protein [Pseudobacteriovorax antillogorgiicola]|uniref:Uncharacterized protein n=1 Tax=Pseudobacteriovorax antillogorgiicola TaxID=1513793 RepID=A0A1Y6BGE9_9BACT|nr:hypothetical protein [Pseudobacteriovorax antillogorgiicola]TCS56259.1 hypothetical protein EDD56_10481 [Pseudobacteriovorax antillogorgiicola]SMF07896.1 hypothetical protein SAMN06296036_104252 [Pseudobacteriovorax antillogorgiicola]
MKNSKIRGFLAILGTLAAGSGLATPKLIEVKLSPSVKLNAMVEDSGLFSIVDYPNILDGTFSLNLIGSTFGNNLDDGTCSAVGTQVRMLDLLPHRRAEIMRKLREESAVRIDSSIASYLDQTLIRQQVKQVAENAGIQAGAFVHRNPYVVGTVNVSLNWESSALIQKVGATEDLKKSLEDIFSIPSPVGGQVSGRIQAMDLACDLRSGKAHISVDISGSYPKYSYEFRTLFDQTLAQDSYQNLTLWEQSNKDVLDDLAPSQRSLVNGVALANILPDDTTFSLFEIITLSNFYFDEIGSLKDLSLEDFLNGVLIQDPPSEVEHIANNQLNHQ